MLMLIKSIDEMIEYEFDKYMEEQYPEIMKIIDNRIRLREMRDKNES